MRYTRTLDVATIVFDPRSLQGRFAAGAEPAGAGSANPTAKISAMRRALVFMLVVAGCGDGDQPAAPTEDNPPGVTCRDIRTKAQAMRIARRVDHRVVAPDGQPRRETLDVIGGSLYATCRNPALRDYRPVAPVLREVQQHFDAEG